MLTKINSRNAMQGIENFVKSAEQMIAKYGWQDRTVMPYGHAVKITKIIDDCRDYARCTSGSKSILIVEANGLVDIMNYWETEEQIPRYRLRYKVSGKVVEVRADLADVCGSDWEMIGLV